jgi:succinate dehydrogenase / fumarate reductase cytochrome b subunit
MAITGVIMMGYVVAHMVGNLKMYAGAAGFDEYAEFLRRIAYPLLPESGFLWIFRVVLLAALVIHLHAAWALTRMNRAANAGSAQLSVGDTASKFASRTMRWTGIIVLAFIVFHLLDLTWGSANPDFVYGDVYDNVVASFERVPVSIFYIIANLALGVHLYHGGWSLFQSMGWNSPRFNLWRRWFAIAFAAVVVAGNISFPVAVLVGVVD